MANIANIMDDHGSSQGKLTHLGATDDSLLTISGTGSPGATINVYQNGALIGHSQADAQGLWVFQSPELEQGLHQFTVSEVDSNGVESLPSQAFQISVDQEALTASELAINGVPKAYVNGDQLSSGKHHFSGKAEANATVEVFDNGQHIGTTSSDSEGNWTLSIDLKEGQHKLSTTVKDDAGNVSQSSEPVQLEVLALSNSTSGTGVTLPPGTSVTDAGYNNNKTPLVNGTATPKAMVYLSVGDQHYGPIQADDQGHWQVQITEPLDEGEHLFRAKAVNDAGTAYDGFTLTIDSIAPDAPTIEYANDDVGAYQGRVEHQESTDDDAFSLHGQGSAGDIIALYHGTSFLGTAVVKSDGSWEYQPTNSFLIGKQSFFAIAFDKAGNQSDASSEFEVTVDRQVEPPEILHIFDDQGASTGEVNSGGDTDDTEPLIVGSAEKGALVHVYIDGNFAGTTRADIDSGEWELQSPLALDEGQHEITAKQVDLAENESALSDLFTFTITLNQGPDAVDDDFTISKSTKLDVLKNDSDPDGAPLKIEEILNQGKFGTASITKSGKINYELSSPVQSTVKDTITYKVSDGKGGFDTAKVTITILPPLEKPTIDLLSSSDSGKFDNDNLTNDTTPTFSGTATANTQLSIYIGNTKIGETTVNSRGEWTFTSPHLDDNDYDFKAVSHRNEESVNSDTLAVTIDTVVDANVVNIGRTYNNAYDFTERTTQNGGKVDNGDSVYHARASEIAWRLTTSEYVDYKIKDIEANSAGSNRMNSLTNGYLATAEGSASSDTDIKPDWFRNISGDTSSWDHVWYTFQATLEDLAGNELVVLLTPTLIDPIAALKDGGYIVTYASLNSSKDGSLDIWAQRYDVNGNTVNEAFVVNSFRLGEQANSDVTGLEDGGFLVTWQSYDQDGDGFGIFAQRYDANSEKVGGEFQVNQYYSSDQSRPEITSLENGGFAVSWMSDGQDGNAAGVYLRVFSADGEALGDEIQVNSQGQGNQALPSITELNDGMFAVSWHANQDGSGNNIWAKIYDQEGNVIKDDFILHDNLAGEQFLSNIRSSADGGFFASWISTSADGANQIQLQSFSATGEARFNQAINITPTNSNSNLTGRPEVSGLDNGEFVVVWSEVNNGVASIFSSRFSSNGELISAESMIPQNQNTSNIEPHIVTLEDGGYLITWTSIDNNTGSVAVFGQRFNNNGESFADVFEVGKIDSSIAPSESALSQQSLDNNDNLLDLDESELGFEGLTDPELSQIAISSDATTSSTSPQNTFSLPLEWSALLDGDNSAKELFEQLEVELPELDAVQFSSALTDDTDSSPTSSPDFSSSLNFYSTEQIAYELEQLFIIQTDIDSQP